MAMKRGVLLLMLVALNAQALDAEDLMNELTWEKRVLLMFAPGAQDPVLRRQEAALASDRAGLAERDMVVIRALAEDGLSIDGVRHEDVATSFYRRFGTDRDKFRVLLIGKDGTVKLDRDDSVPSAELFALIDSMPMRRHEMLQQGN